MLLVERDNLAVEKEIPVALLPATVFLAVARTLFFAANAGWTAINRLEKIIVKIKMILVGEDLKYVSI